MTVSDFLFNGKPPASVTTYGTSSTTMPDWYTDYTKGILSKANAIANEPYQAYGGPRVAGLTNDQKTAAGSVRAGQGMYKGTMDNAISGAFASGDPNAGVNAAQPYLNKAGTASYDTVGKYMNPYEDGVVKRIGEVGARNLSENLMPAINQDFVRAGQYGSRNMMGEVGKALRDTNESILAQQGNLMQSGYNNAMTAAQTDAQRFGNVGEAAGNLTNTGLQQQLDANRTAAGLGASAQDSVYKDASALDTIGTNERQLNQQNLDLAYGDFQAQRDDPLKKLNVVQGALQGQQIPTSGSTTNTAPGTSFSPSPLQSVVGTGMSTWNLLNG